MAQLVVENFQCFIWAVASAMRIFALTHLSRPLTLAVFIFTATPFVVNMWTLSVGISGITDLVSLGNISELLLTTTFRAVAISRSCAIIADLLVIAVTWQSTYTTALRGGNGQRAIAGVLFMNGAIYFMAIVATNALNLLLTLVSVLYSLSSFSQVAMFTNPLTVIMLYRFLLSLQAANQETIRLAGPTSTLLHGGDDESRTGSVPLRFASRIIRSMGASIVERPEASLCEDLDSSSGAVAYETTLHGGLSGGTTPDTLVGGTAFGSGTVERDP
ncbi:hypothetical protein C8Q77DRAFT_1160040 [Trametes polyzona]|nr:hypothetical protein C8Q77DRAFT_1160040 [Trametes polyzona]